MSVREPSDRSADRNDAALETIVLESEREGEMRDEIRKTVTALMPWGVSILAHAVLVLFAFFLVWSTIVLDPEERPDPVQLIGPPDVVAMNPSPEMSQDQPEAGSAMITPVIAVPTDPKPIVVGFDKPVVSIPQPGKGIEGIGELPGKGKGTGTGPFDPEVGGASSVVFVIDASGSMVDVLPFVMDELKKTVTKVDPNLQATIVVFSGTGVSEVPGGGGVRGLRKLTSVFKDDIRKWATLSNHRFETGGPGSANVLEAIDRGLSYKPELMFLLSDNLTGGGQGATKHELFQSDIMQLINRHQNEARSVKINTIQFLYEDPLVRAGLTGTLRLIADETGGDYTFFGQEDLGLR